MDDDEADGPPPWWLEDLAAAIARIPKRDNDRKGGVDVHLARLLVDDKLRGADRARALTAAKVRVGRFLKNKNRSAASAAEFIKVLGLRRFAFVATSSEMSEAMAMAARDPVKVLLAMEREAQAEAQVRQRIQDLAVARLIKSAESGSESTDGHVFGDREGQPTALEPSEYANSPGKRRGRGGAGAGSASAPKK